MQCTFSLNAVANCVAGVVARLYAPSLPLPGGVSFPCYTDVATQFAIEFVNF
jgi:hypothetical protein